MAPATAVHPLRRVPFRRIVGATALAWLALCPMGSASAQTTPQNAAMLSPPGAAYRLNDRTLGLGYDVYIGGIYAFHFEATLSVDERSYNVALAGGTTGFIGRMFSWQADMRSVGGIASAQPAPAGLSSATFESATTWQGKPRKTTLRFHDDGRYEVALEPPDDTDTATSKDADGAPPAVLPAGTMDPVAAAIAALAGSARDGTCARRETVFDGRRYYELIVRDGDGDNVAPPNHLSAYAGPALKCRIAMKRLAGFGKRRYAQYWDEETGTLPTIWSAPLVPGMPLVPVRFLAPINMAGNIGSMMVHLVHAELREGGTTRPILDIEKKR
jgi:hypothetical protein